MRSNDDEYYFQMGYEQARSEAVANRSATLLIQMVAALCKMVLAIVVLAIMIIVTCVKVLFRSIARECKKRAVRPDGSLWYV